MTPDTAGLASRMAVVTAPRRFEFRLGDLSEPADRAVGIRVTEVGVCGSDLTMWTGAHPVLRPPLVLGHEAVGVVESAPRASSFTPGQTVVLFPPVGCGQCRRCRVGDPHLCTSVRLYGGGLPGAMSSRIWVREANLVAADAGVPRAVLAITEPLAVAVHAVDRSAAAAADQCLVVGGGPIGLLVALVLRSRGVSKIVLAERLQNRRELARAAGFAEVCDAAPTDYEPNIAFDCVGGGQVARDLVTTVEKGGRVVLVGIQPRDITIDGPAVQRGEVDVIGTVFYHYQDFTTAMRLLSSGLLPDEITADIEHHPIEQAPQLFADMESGRASRFKYVLHHGDRPSGEQQKAD